MRKFDGKNLYCYIKGILFLRLTTIFCQITKGYSTCHDFGCSNKINSYICGFEL